MFYERNNVFVAPFLGNVRDWVVKVVETAYFASVGYMVRDAAESVKLGNRRSVILAHVLTKCAVGPRRQPLDGSTVCTWLTEILIDILSHNVHKFTLDVTYVQKGVQLVTKVCYNLEFSYIYKHLIINKKALCFIAEGCTSGVDTTN